MMLKTLLLVSTLTVAQGLMAQQIFRTTDEHGNVIFTDKPPASSTTTEEVELPPTNTTPATPIPPRPEPEPGPKEPE